MRVLFVTTECSPLFQLGGVADVSRDLAVALTDQGCDVRVVLPWYPSMARSNSIHVAAELDLELGAGRAERVVVGETEVDGVRVNLVRPRRGAGGFSSRRSELRRFWRFCVAIAELMKRRVLQAEIVHCNDFWVGLLPQMLAERKVRVRTVMTVHNAGLQGVATRVSNLRADRGTAALPQLDDPSATRLNLLKRGLLWADRATTVSPSYAADLRTRERGMGLHEVVRRRGVVGILNGIDLGRFDPWTDSALPQRFRARAPGRRRQSQVALRAAVGLAGEAKGPLVSMVARLDLEKGYDLALVLAGPLVRLGFQFLFTGAGSPALERLIRAECARHPRAAAFRRFGEIPETLVLAGSDLVMMPSVYESCGLVQLKAMRYGAVPVVRATGGLRDTVQPFDPLSGAGNGFVFERRTPFALADALVRARASFERPREWSRVVHNAMTTEVGWSRSARAYLRIYQELTLGKLARPAGTRGGARRSGRAAAPAPRAGK